MAAAPVGAHLLELDGLLHEIFDAVTSSRVLDDVELVVDSISRVTLLATDATFGMPACSLPTPVRGTVLPQIVSRGRRAAAQCVCVCVRVCAVSLCGLRQGSARTAAMRGMPPVCVARF
jgi:hypothetical protein